MRSVRRRKTSAALRPAREVRARPEDQPGVAVAGVGLKVGLQPAERRGNRRARRRSPGCRARRRSSRARRYRLAESIGGLAVLFADQRDLGEPDQRPRLRIEPRGLFIAVLGPLPVLDPEHAVAERMAGVGRWGSSSRSLDRSGWAGRGRLIRPGGGGAGAILPRSDVDRRGNRTAERRREIAVDDSRGRRCGDVNG